MFIKRIFKVFGQIFKQYRFFKNMNDFTPNPELEKQNNESQVFVCTQCGECCHIREQKNITKEQESSYYSYMYKSFGIVYFARLSEITINVWPEEKDILERVAEKKGINISLKPKRGFYNKKDNAFVIIDYFIDHDVCPFFNEGKKQCGVYEHRPLICRSYPLLTTKTLGKCKYKKIDVEAYDSEKPIAETLEKRTTTIKRAIKELKDKGEIDTSIAPAEINELMKTAEIKELRLK